MAQEFEGFTYLADDVFEFFDRMEMLPVYRCDAFWDGVDVRDSTNEFVLLPSATFHSGFSEEDVSNWTEYFEGSFNFEPGLTEVSVESFLIARTPLTQSVLDRVVKDLEFVDQRNAEGPAVPAHGIGYEASQKIAGELGLSIPTGAQWEFAARGGSESTFYFGAVELMAREYAWYDTVSPMGVCQKRPNGFGLYDVSGNVWEWCSDAYEDEQFGVTLRPMRGGAWNCSNVISLMPSFETTAGENYTGPDVGVRFCFEI